MLGGRSAFIRNGFMLQNEYSRDAIKQQCISSHSTDKKICLTLCITNFVGGDLSRDYACDDR